MIGHVCALSLRLVGCMLLMITGLITIVEAQQPQPFYNKSGAAWISVVLPDNWSTDQVSLRLISSIDQAPVNSPLAGWTRTAKVDKRTISDPICRERHGRLLRPDELPAIFLQRSDGGVLYKATRETLPADPFELGREMDFYASLDPMLEVKGQLADSRHFHGSIDWVNQCPGGNCPDGMCPINPINPVPPINPVGPLLPDSRIAVPSGLSEPSPLIVALLIGGAVLLAFSFSKRGPK